MRNYTASILEAPGVFNLIDVPELEVPDGWAVLRVSYTGICGSDFPIVDGAHPRASFPLVMGHEITGIVEHPGSGNLKPGMRVAVNPLLTCGSCGPCSQGLGHICRNLRLLGIDAPGSLASLIAVPPSNLVPFRSGVDPTEAALAEPLAVAVHAVRRSRLASGERVVIFGAGPIGLLVGLVARHAGAAEITIVEPSSARREAAVTLGFSAIEPGDLQASRDSGDEGPAVVFDCAGHPSVAGQLANAAPARGRIVIVAVYHGPAAFDLRELAFAEQEVLGVRVYAPEDFVAAVRLVDEGSLGLERIPVSVLPLKEVAQGVNQARSSGGVVKTLIQSGH